MFFEIVAHLQEPGVIGKDTQIFQLVQDGLRLDCSIVGLSTA